MCGAGVARKRSIVSRGEWQALRVIDTIQGDTIMNVYR
jgi:hypothetical protein